MHHKPALYRVCQALNRAPNRAAGRISYSTISAVPASSAQYHQLPPILLVGLGNFTHPQTRHSVGMILLDRLLLSLKGAAQPWRMDRSMGGWTTEIHLDSTMPLVVSRLATLAVPQKKRPKTQTDSIQSGLSNTISKIPDMPIPWRRTVILLKPAALMNISGLSVGRAMRHLKLKPIDIIIVHDDIERKLGALSAKAEGSANGHNGIRSILKSITSDKFLRLRVGVGRPEDKSDVANYVLEPFTPAEQTLLFDNVTLLFEKALLGAVSQSPMVTK
ncbi:hypothetical protein BASA61_005653 [Batrachochytrium salamandrivorans]|nr:hypothetical protein BASA60_003157 [Batrachochytrium salamandrivorans]KAH6589323.1 hypothetical protein BASA61_005653 [Batrachochytrium salamandrivorans]KAH9276890.1 hypothetical protein BASA83_000402 [Batrachochytrium salamandrivorans]